MGVNVSGVSQNGPHLHRLWLAEPILDRNLGQQSLTKVDRQPYLQTHESVEALSCILLQVHPERRRLHWTVLLLPAGVAAFLGTWQVGRQQWKLEQVQQREAGLQVCQVDGLTQGRLIQRRAQ